MRIKQVSELVEESWKLVGEKCDLPICRTKLTLAWKHKEKKFPWIECVEFRYLFGKNMKENHRYEKTLLNSKKNILVDSFDK